MCNAHKLGKNLTGKQWAEAFNRLHQALKLSLIRRGGDADAICKKLSPPLVKRANRRKEKGVALSHALLCLASSAVLFGVVALLIANALDNRLVRDSSEREKLPNAAHPAQPENSIRGPVLLASLEEAERRWGKAESSQPSVDGCVCRHWTKDGFQITAYFSDDSIKHLSILGDSLDPDAALVVLKNMAAGGWILEIDNPRDKTWTRADGATAALSENHLSISHPSWRAIQDANWKKDQPQKIEKASRL